MKQLSQWAKGHVWQSRIMIGVIYILLNATGIFTGTLLNQLHVILPSFYFILCMIITIPLWLFYPARKDFPRRTTSTDYYYRRKLFEGIMGLVTFLMIVYTGNHLSNLFTSMDTAQASNITYINHDSINNNNPHIKNFIALLKSQDVQNMSRHEKMQLIKKQIREIKHDQGMSKSEKTLLIILSIVIAFALIYGLAAWACNLSCAGSETAAIIIGYGGTAVVIFLLYLVIRGISRRPVKPESESK